LSEALDSLRSQTFDALLVDLSVPDLESPDALSRLAEVAGNLPVILLISEDDTDRMVRARSMGIHSWLRKETLTVSRLANEIGSALEPAPAADTR
jgi:DNA-binding NarL/FixJ family response regulator